MCTVKCYATGLSFISGISSRYDTTYPNELQGYITEEEFSRAMERLNDKLAEFWPCNTCYIFGYACAPLTLGMSLFCPNYCISQAEENAEKFLNDLSKTAKYYDRNISWKLRKSCWKSWIEISFPISMDGDNKFSQNILTSQIQVVGIV
jgi:hypothetical protein